MNLGRSDTYIDVYLPRLDGDDTRRYIQPNSPIFNSNSLYKFSDEIVKDRRLFLGRKQMSLYEIYYKVEPGHEANGETPDVQSEIKEDAGVDEADDTAEANVVSEMTHRDVPRINRVSLSLDGTTRRYKKYKGRRFNEPLNAYISNRKKVQSLNRFEPNGEFQRQLTSFDLEKSIREKSVTNEKTMVKENALTRERTSTELPSTKTFQRLLQKSQSAPMDTRKVRGLGLPPIILNKRQPTFVPPSTPDTTRLQSSLKAMPMRPSSKPHTIWRQTTNIFVPNRLTSTSNTPKLLSSSMSLSETPKLYINDYW